MASVLGVGIDVVAIARVARLHTRFGDRFLARALHPTEVARALASPPGALGTFLASRWAAKEALHKALRGPRLLFPDMEVAADVRGGPILRLHGAAAAHAASAGIAALHLSISHERDVAVAVVVATGSGTATP